MKKVRAIVPYLLSILCILGGAYYLDIQVASFNSSRVSNEMVSRWDEHMKPVHDALPSDVFMVGYLEESDAPGSNMAYDDAEFFMTQYSMAPVSLKKGFQTSWIIGNFGDSLSFEDIQPWLDLKLSKYEIQNFGFGIYLIHDILE